MTKIGQKRIACEKLQNASMCLTLQYLDGRRLLWKIPLVKRGRPKLVDDKAL